MEVLYTILTLAGITEIGLGLLVYFRIKKGRSLAL